MPTDLDSFFISEDVCLDGLVLLRAGLDRGEVKAEVVLGDQPLIFGQPRLPHTRLAVEAAGQLLKLLLSARNMDAT